MPPPGPKKVAKLAGVSKGTLFLYFASKEELFKAVVRVNIVGRFAGWNDEFERFQGGTADMLRYCMRSWWERSRLHQGLGHHQTDDERGAQLPGDCAAFSSTRWCSPAMS